MSPVKYAVIAAAGLGSRLGLGLPKCMLEISGRTLLSRQVESLHGLVEQIFVVVGYREQMIIEYCAARYPEVIIVRNPEFRTTNTAFSLSLATRSLKGKVLFMDGDLIVPAAELKSFLDAAKHQEILVGCCRAASDNAVYVDLEKNQSGGMEVKDFSRERPSAHEWGNIFVGPADIMNNASRYVYEQLMLRLPLPGYVLQLAEVDTPNDLTAATKFIAEHSL